MARIKRPGFSDFEKAEIWRGWKSGKTLNGIGRELNRAGPLQLPYCRARRASVSVCDAGQG
jgi:hypothetical protein